MLLKTLFILCLVSLVKSSTDDSNNSLVLVHTLFRHGNRTIEDNIYDTNPYGDESFYAPYGYNQLTKEGKRTEFKIGKALRERYDNLLGSEYNINLIDARSTVANRTKMSLLLVLASLYPPSGELIWNDQLNWQPIPYNTFDVDKEIYGRKVCINYKKAYKKLVKTDEILSTLKPYQEMFDYLTEKTGKKIQKAKKAADLYLELITQAAYGYPLEDWTSKYMDQMYNITIYNYHLLAYTKKLKRLSAGYLLKKIIADSETIITNPKSPSKMYLYSAHEKNIANLLVTLNLFDDMIPTFGSYVLIELHLIDNVYGFKFFYQNYRKEEPVLLTIPGCDEFCPIATFKELVSDYLPADSYCEVGSDDDDD
ncbi:venom acid phosphatase Acph-1-like [Anthonomus grandis grandis]|uniref:venom acid phosphatase Acph-1-like n=1 Tax=Anthonomus grandis grandis TaxID=2921223 RepID=UPI002165F307|nr:venom acid phosphatase Acph-1-like [Anthonomus grandis grandis]